MGRLFFSWISVSNAAREAAAYAAGNPTDTAGITTHALLETNTQGQGGEGTLAVTATCANPSRTTIACSTAAGGNGTGNTVTVNVTRSFSFVTPIIGNLLGSVINLSSSATSAVYGLQPNKGGASGTCTPPTLAAFSVSATNRTVSVDASSSTPNSSACAIASYEWDWGDGIDHFPPSVGKQTTFTYDSDGTYTITLTVSNPAGDLATTQSVTVPGPLPSASTSPNPTIPPTPSPSATNPCSMSPTFTYTIQGGSGKVNFFGAYTGQPAPAQWWWWYGDSYVGFGQAPARHDYVGSGPYTATLLITNGSCQDSISQLIYP